MRLVRLEMFKVNSVDNGRTDVNDVPIERNSTTRNSLKS